MAGEVVKHYAVRGRRPVSTPFLLFEVKIDIQDVRSGYRGSRHGYFQGQWLEDAELNWSAGMVQEVDPGGLEEIRPPFNLGWPSFGDEKIVRYLGAYRRPCLWKNGHLELYSGPQESRAEFVARCREALVEARARELKKIQEIFLRRFLELEKKILEGAPPEEWSEEAQAHRLSALRRLFSRVREDLSCWFLPDDYQRLEAAAVSWKGELDLELQERLDDLGREILARYNQVNDEFLERAAEVEVYEVPLHHAQVDIVSRGMLWSQ